MTITYELLPDEKVKDTTAYQDSPKPGAKVKSISGINATPPDNPGSFDWRGTGWLKIASTHWEVLGWGDAPANGDAGNGGGEGAEGEEEGNRWVVTYFAKTLFTPAGVDVYSRKREGMPAASVEEIKRELKGLGSAEIDQLVEGMFEVKHDDEEK